MSSFEKNDYAPLKEQQETKNKSFHLFLELDKSFRGPYIKSFFILIHVSDLLI